MIQMEYVSLAVEGEKAHLYINLDGNIRKVREMLRPDLLVDLRIEYLNLEVISDFMGKILTYYSYKPIFEIIRRANIKKLEFTNVNSIILLREIANFLKTYEVHSLYLPETYINTDILVTEFDEVKVTHLNEEGTELGKMFRERRNLKQKLILMWIHKYHLVPNFPPRGVILMICEYL